MTPSGRSARVAENVYANPHTQILRFPEKVSMVQIAVVWAYLHGDGEVNDGGFGAHFR